MAINGYIAMAKDILGATSVQLVAVTGSPAVNGGEGGPIPKIT
jgi:hypothetical protein